MGIAYLFSKNKLIGSTIIRAGTCWVSNEGFSFDQVPSHAAVLIDETWVIESVMHGGVRIVPYKQWKEINQEIFKLVPKAAPKEHYKDLLFEMWGKKYDKKGILFFAWSILKYKLFNTPMPEINAWEQEDKFFCTEFASRSYDGTTGSMRSPAQLARIIIDKEGL